MHLKEGSFLQGGRYRIERMLGQGGFGITYLGMQTGLNRKVAIKEFFMKEYCNREEETSHVSVPSVGSKELVKRFRQKFVKEAQTISELDNHHIVRIHDVFEENETAYYVMEYLPGGDLRSRIPKSGMPETEALSYIRQIADALMFVHERNILHLDIKPSNVLFRSNGEAVLVDFGLSKHYDETSGDQTSSTPLGLSEGYAPTEQYECGGVSSFSPATDIYSLGATFYCLLQGSRPPKASIVLNDGLPALPSHVSAPTRKAIEAAMQSRRKDRPQSVYAFLSLLDSSLETDNDETVIDVVSSEPAPPVSSVPDPNPFPRIWLKPLVLCLLIALCFWGLHECIDPEHVGGGGNAIDSLSTDTLVQVDSLPVVSPVIVNPVEPIKDDIPSIAPLYVSTSPVGATVYLDGKKIGKSPLEGKEVSRGKHTVKLLLDGYEPFSKQYTFGDKPVVINESLVAVPARVPVHEAQLEPVKAATTGSINGHEWVDLGLSVKWATMNVGAGSPSDYGDYFAWGEVHPMSEYTEENSRTNLKSMGAISGNSQYDAARYHWGSSWRLPTEKELKELDSTCRWTLAEQDGYKGYKVVGPNGNSIFLPVAGSRYRAWNYGVGKSGAYWGDLLEESNPGLACMLTFDDDRRSMVWAQRHFCRSVRPVSD
ncbi:MAG: serine/threonine protein kinase [Bacteroidaceae bacterium]|nr:serine/threonine protein kinase [Bacteroidaceae bacterium]